MEIKTRKVLVCDCGREYVLSKNQTIEPTHRRIKRKGVQQISNIQVRLAMQKYLDRNQSFTSKDIARDLNITKTRASNHLNYMASKVGESRDYMKQFGKQRVGRYIRYTPL